jgi:hypothetical protein
MRFCEMCQEKPIEEDESVCWSCSLFAGDDDCPSCGSTLDVERACSCSLNGPRPSTREQQGRWR